MQVEIICTFDSSVGVVSQPLDEKMEYLFASLTNVKGDLSATFVNLHLACRENGQGNLHIVYTMHSLAGEKRWHRRLISAENIKLEVLEGILQTLQHLEFVVQDKGEWQKVYASTRAYRVYLTTSEHEEAALCDLLGMYESDTESEDEGQQESREKQPSSAEQCRGVLKQKLEKKILERGNT